MSTVYLITSGEYSDYSVDAVYADKAHAERHVELEDDARIEEYELLTAEPTGWPTTHVGVDINADGSIRYEREYVSNEVQDAPTPVKVTDNSSYVSADYLSRYGLTVNGQGTDAERVRKAVQDRVAKVRAQLAGL